MLVAAGAAEGALPFCPGPRHAGRAAEGLGKPAPSLIVLYPGMSDGKELSSVLALAQQSCLPTSGWQGAAIPCLQGAELSHPPSSAVGIWRGWTSVVPWGDWTRSS